VTKQLFHLLFPWKSVRCLNLVNATPSHVERISLRLYSLIVEFAFLDLLRLQVSNIGLRASGATIRPLFGVHVHPFHEGW